MYAREYCVCLLNYGLMEQQYPMPSCPLVSPHQGVWYYGSDVSMFFLSLYAICTRCVRTSVVDHDMKWMHASTPITYSVLLFHRSLQDEPQTLDKKPVRS